MRTDYGGTLKQIVIVLSPGLLRRIDRAVKHANAVKLAKDRRLNRSAFIRQAAEEKLNA